MDTTTRINPGDQLDRLVQDARTPQEHALLHYAFARVGTYDSRIHGARADYRALVMAYYTELHAQDAFADYNATPATPMHALYLSKIQQANDGINAQRINGTYRALFLYRRWVTAKTRDGADTGPRDWAATIHLTDRGAIHLASAMSRPIDLTDAQATLLGRIERFGHGGYTGQRQFGQPRDWALCELFDLITATEAEPGRRYHITLTATGRDALERWRDRPRPARMPTSAQYNLMKELIAGHTTSRSSLYAVGTYDVCESRGWVAWGDPASEGGPAPLFITAAGREAVDRYSGRMLTADGNPAKPRTRHPRLTPSRLVAGQWVRLANRRGYRDLGPGWVVISHVQRVPSQGRIPGGYIVWVFNADRTGIVQYAGGTVFTGTTRFEIKAGQ